MEPYPQFPSLEDSQTSRSRPRSRQSLTEASSRSALGIGGPSVPDASLHFTGAINQAPPPPPSGSFHQSPPSQLSPEFVPTSSPPLYAPNPLPSQNIGLQGWAFIDPTHSTETPLLRIEQAEDQVDHPPSRSSYTSEPESYGQSSMSAMGVQYFPRFDASVNRSTYTWPVFDQAESFTEESGLLDPFFDPNLMSGASRSISSSPPQGMFTTEQRELKRQRDQLRRDSKTQMRRERSSSNSYHPSLSNTPDIIPRALGGYSQPSTSTSSSVNLPLQPYMSPPQIPSTQSPELYQPQYSMVNNDFSGGYLLPYSTAQGEPSIPPLSQRPLSMAPMASGSDMQFYYSGQPTSVAPENPDSVRVVQSRPKPQCWDHGCNGRKFSTFSNLLRHQREKSGVASKPTCPKCGAEFTRTTARNGHMAHEKCKQRRDS